MLASTVVLICISLYHASTLRAVTQQRTLRTKVLSRSYLNRAAEATGMPKSLSGNWQNMSWSQVARRCPTVAGCSS